MGSMRLLFKRLARSQMRSSILGVLFLMLIVVASMVSVAMAEHTRNGARVYDDFYAETNLADLTATAMTGWTFDSSDLEDACASVQQAHADGPTPIKVCETRYVHQEAFIKQTEEGDAEILMIAHGIDTTMGEGLGSVTTPWITDDWGRMAAAAGEVTIDHHMHVELGIEIGEQVRLVLNGEQVNLTVTGYANHAHHLWYVPGLEQMMPAEGTFAVIYLPLDQLTQLLGQNDQNRTALYVDVEGTPAYDLQDTMVEEGAELRQLQSDLMAALGDEGVENIRVEDRSGQISVELLRQDLEGNRKTTPFFMAMLTGISALVISISLERLVRRQSREIAVLRSIGVDSPSLLFSYLAIPAFYGLVGGTIGVALGRWYLSPWMSTWYFDFIGVPIVSINHYNDIALQVWLAVLAILLLFGLWPAYRATRLSPLEVMRQEASAKPSRLLQALTAWLPPSAGLGIRATFRRPARLTLTVIGLGLSMVLVGGMTMITEGMHDWVRDSQDVETWDARAAYYPFQDAELREWVANNSEHYEVEWSLIWEVNASDDAKTIMLHGVQGFSADGVSTMHKSRVVEGRLPVPGATPPEALVDQGALSILGWTIGEEVSLVVGVTDMPFTIVGVVDEIDRSVWVHHSDLVSGLGSIGESVYNVLFIRNINGGDIANETGLQEIPRVSVTIKQQMVDTFEESWERNRAGFVIFTGIGALIAIAVLVNTLMINLTEHDTEFATLRILGASQSRIQYILLFEHIVIGIIGGIIGAAASVATAEYMARLFNTWSWYFELPLRWDIVAVVFAAIVIASLLVTPIGLSRVKRMDLVEKAKEYSH